MTVAENLSHVAPLLPSRGGQEAERAARVLAGVCTAALLLFLLSSWLIAPRSTAAQTGYIGVYLLAAVLCNLAARAEHDAGGVRWEYIAIAILSIPTAIIVRSRSAAMADLVALAFYPAVAAAIAPRPRALASERAASDFIDVVLLIAGAITIAAYAAFLLLAGSNEQGLYQPLAPAAAVLVMLPAVVRLKSRDGLRLTPGTGLLFCGLVLSIVVDVSTAGSQASRVTWSAAVWLMGLGAMTAARAHPLRIHAPAAQPAASWWPAAAAGGVYALLASQIAAVEPVTSRVLITGGTIVTCLLLVRQIAALRDTQRLAERIAGHHKRDAVGRAAADVAHEFNNLLTAMVGHIEVLDADLPPGHPGRMNVRELRRAAANATDLTRSLLGAARKDEGTPVVVDVNAVVSEAVSMLRPSLAAVYDLHVTLCDGECLARGDGQGLLHALFNLAINARDAMPDGGPISIETRVVPAASLPAGVPLPHADHVCIAVRDHGIGMTDEVIARAFDPFFTTKPDGEGTGLGLPLVFSAMRGNGGWVDVVSSPGRGSTFTLWLPRAESSTPRR